MKSLQERLVESLQDDQDCIIEASNEFVNFVRNLIYTNDEPESNQDQYIELIAYGNRWTEIDSPYFIKIKDLGKYTDEAGLMSLIYNFAKTRNSKMSHVEACAWDEDENKYMSFCTASLQKKDRSWHPNWVDWEAKVKNTLDT